MFDPTQKLGKIFLAIGIILLLETILEEFNVFHLVGGGFLIFGWAIILIGAILINIRTTAWTFFLMSFYSFVLFGKMLEGGDIGVYIGNFLFLIVISHLSLGLILGIISFIRHKNRKT